MCRMTDCQRTTLLCPSESDEPQPTRMHVAVVVSPAPFVTTKQSAYWSLASFVSTRTRVGFSLTSATAYDTTVGGGAGARSTAAAKVASRAAAAAMVTQKHGSTVLPAAPPVLRKHEARSTASAGGSTKQEARAVWRGSTKQKHAALAGSEEISRQLCSHAVLLVTPT